MRQEKHGGSGWILTEMSPSTRGGRAVWPRLKPQAISMLILPAKFFSCHLRGARGVFLRISNDASKTALI